MPTPDELQQDKDFMSANPNDQALYLAHTDPDFKAASSADQAAYLAHVTKQPTGVVPSKGGVGGMLETAQEAYQGEPAKAPAFSTEYAGNLLRRLGSSAGRVLTGMGSVPYQAEQAVVTPPRNEEEAQTETAISGMSGPAGGRLGLAAKRMLLDPSAEATGHINALVAKQDAATAERKRLGLPAPADAISPLHRAASEYVGKGVAAIPFVGPFVAGEGGLGERAAKGDIAGALGEAAGWTVAPEVLKEAMPGGEISGLPKGAEAFPTVEAAKNVAKRGLGKVAAKGLEAPEVLGAGLGMTGALGGPMFGLSGVYLGAKIGRLLEKMDIDSSSVDSWVYAGKSPAETNYLKLDKISRTAEGVFDKVDKERDAYAASEAQGQPVPEELQKRWEKAHREFAEATYHKGLAEQAMLESETPESKAAPAPAMTAEEAVSRITKEMKQKALPAGEEQKALKARPTEHKGLGEVQPETFPQIPTGKPEMAPEGTTMALPGEKGIRVGKPRLLGAGETLEEPTQAPGAPKTPLGEILPPEKPAQPGRLGTLKAQGGKVVETEPELQQKIEEGLLRGSKEAKPVAMKPLGAAEKPLGEAMGKEELPEYRAPAEAVSPTKGEAPKAAAEQSPEDLAKVEEVVKNHTDQELARLGKKYSIDEDKYDFSKRDERRHRIERDQFVKDILAKMPEKDIANISRLADAFDNKDDTTWTEAERSNLSRAQRSRAIMQEHSGGPESVAGGAPEKNEEGIGGLERWQGKNPLDKASVRPVSENINLPPEKAQPFRAEDKTWEEQLVAARKAVNQSKAGGAPESFPQKGEELGADAKRAQEEGYRDEQIAKDHNDTGGSSVHEAKGNLRGKEGYSVSQHPEVSKVLDKENITAEDVKAFRDDPKVQAIMQDNPDAFIGTWKADGKTHMDISVFEADKDKAMKMAQTEPPQKAIYDLKAGKEIPVKQVPKDDPIKSIQNLKFGKVSSSVWGTIRDEGLDEEHNAHKPSQWLVSDLPISEKDSDGLKNLNDETLEKFNAFDIALKEKFFGKLVDLIDYDKGTVKIVTKTGNVPNYPEGYPEGAKEGGKGELPPVSGGSAKMGPTIKTMPTEDELVKKYGEADDPGRVAFLLADGRGVAQEGGMVHDEMLGGHPTDSPARREVFVNDAGAIRMRVHGALGDRQFSMSLPEKGVTETQLEKLVKWAPQLRSGDVYLEVARPEGGYKKLGYGKANTETLTDAIRSLVPVLNEKGSPVDEFGNPTISGGAPSAAAAPAKEEKTLRDEDFVVKSLSQAEGKPPFIFMNGDMVSPMQIEGENATHQMYVAVASGKDKFANADVPAFLKKTQAVRVIYPEFTGEDTVGFEMKQKPTPEQVKRIAEIAKEQNARQIWWDMPGNSGGGSVGDFQRVVESAAVAPAKETDPYLYHVTPQDNLSNIKKKGLLADKGGDYYEGVPKSTYFTEKEGIPFWKKDIKDTYGKEPAVIKVLKSDLSTREDMTGLLDSGAAAYRVEHNVEPESIEKHNELPGLAEKHLTPEERAGVTKTTRGAEGFANKLAERPELKEWVDAAQAGEGGRKWYQRGTAAFEAMMKEAPDYFKEEDRDKFLNLVAALSPQQTVAMNLKEALSTWSKYVDMGRPEGSKLEKMLGRELTLPESKVPNAMKAIAEEPMWPDLSKNENFKVPSFAANLKGLLNYVTNDGWMALFGESKSKGLGKPSNYHPLSVMARAAAEELNWSPAEAQAAIWAFTKTFTEHGVSDPEQIRQYSEDFADIMAHDPEVRAQLKELGVDLGELDKHLEDIGEKPQVSNRRSSSAENSLRQFVTRVEKTRGKGTIPAPKTGLLGFGKSDEATEFNPEQFRTQTSGMNILGKKKSSLGKAKK